MYAQEAPTMTAPGKKQGLSLFRKSNNHILEEDLEILENLEFIKEDLSHAHDCLNHITDPLLIDSFIFQIQSLNKMYQFYHNLCRDKGLVADITT